MCYVDWELLVLIKGQIIVRVLIARCCNLFIVNSQRGMMNFIKGSHRTSLNSMHPCALWTESVNQRTIGLLDIGESSPRIIQTDD